MRVREWLIAILALTLLAGGGCHKKREPRTEYDWWQAAYEGNTQKAMELIARRVSPHVTYADGQTPLHIAAERGHLEMVQLLVRCGAHVDALDKYGQRPIMLAMAHGRKAVVECLVSEGADVNLQVAAYFGDVAKIKELIESGKADVKGRDGGSAMYQAVSQGQRQIVEMLIAAGADLGIGPGDDDGTPLHDAVEAGRLDMVELLIDSGADPNAGRRGSEWETPLLLAAELENLGMVKFLLARGASPNVVSEDDFWYLPLRAAIVNGHVEIAEALIAAGADLKAADTSGWSLLHEAVMDRSPRAEGGRTPLSMIELLIGRGANVNVKDKEGVTPLHCAAHEGCGDVVPLLLARGADVNARTVHDPCAGQIAWERDNGLYVVPGETPLHEAVVGGEPNVVRLLIAHGAQLNASDESGSTALHYAAARTKSRIAEVLLAAGADANVRDKGGIMPLAVALRNGCVETAKALIAGGAEKVVLRRLPAEIPATYAPDPERLPLLHRAVRGYRSSWRGDYVTDDEPNLVEFRREWIELLLANGADPNERDEKGDSPLQTALSLGDEESARQLIAHGCDVNIRNNAGSTALHLAVADGRRELISLLLAKGADVNAQGNDGDTPLHSAALRGRKDIVELLLARGADPSLRNSRSRTPRDEAARRGHAEIVRLLEAKP